ncbi:MAG: HAD-IA family hydrolase [Pseudomonadota bacterium]|nr:HAD-IA family hydrolase [Pseudomonadota bacterium]
MQAVGIINDHALHCFRREQLITPALRIEQRSFSAFLLDMDGTLLTSIVAAERVWGAWAARQGLDVAAFLPTIHGMRQVDTIRRLALPGIDPDAEAAAITRAELEDVAGIEAIAGAVAFLAALPPARWAVVTSAPRALALRRLQAAGLPLPGLLITAEDVVHGKPAPDCFRLAADRLGVAVEDCLVFEDSPAGVAAAEAAGASLLVISATHLQPMATAHPAVEGYGGLSVESEHTGTLRLRGVATSLQASSAASTPASSGSDTTSMPAPAG